MSKYILPVLLLILFAYALIKRVNLYHSFAEGGKEALLLAASILPYIAAIFAAVALFRASGLSLWFSQVAAPFFEFFGIPKELAEILFIRPLSGSGSLALLEQVYEDYGADSYIARCASCIVGASETVFYITAVYFSSAKTKKLRYAVPVSLLACFAGAIAGCLLCQFM